MHADLPRFLGSAEHALDDKGRLIVPARFRERLGPGFVITIALPEPCLALYPSVTWGEFCAQLEAAPRKDERFQMCIRDRRCVAVISIEQRLEIGRAARDVLVWIERIVDAARARRRRHDLHEPLCAGDAQRGRVPGRFGHEHRADQPLSLIHI